MNKMICSHATKAFLKNFPKTPVLYVGEVGSVQYFDREKVSFKPVKLYKYGITNDPYRRIVYNHGKTFEYFDLKYIRESQQHRKAEVFLTKTLVEKGIHLRMNPIMNTLNSSQMKELFFIDDARYKLDEITRIIDDCINSLEGDSVV